MLPHAVNTCNKPSVCLGVTTTYEMNLTRFISSVINVIDVLLNCVLGRPVAPQPSPQPIQIQMAPKTNGKYVILNSSTGGGSSVFPLVSSSHLNKPMLKLSTAQPDSSPAAKVVSSTICKSPTSILVTKKHTRDTQTDHVGAILRPAVAT